MSAFDIVRMVLAAVPAALWLVSSFANIYIASLAIFNRQSPSPVPVLGSVAGLLAVVVQPIPLHGIALAIALMLAMLPDIAWSFGPIVARLLDFFRTPKHRFR